MIWLVLGILGVLVIGFAYAADQWHHKYVELWSKYRLALVLNEALMKELDEERVVVLPREMSVN